MVFTIFLELKIDVALMGKGIPEKGGPWSRKPASWAPVVSPPWLNSWGQRIDKRQFFLHSKITIHRMYYLNNMLDWRFKYHLSHWADNLKFKIPYVGKSKWREELLLNPSCHLSAQTALRLLSAWLGVCSRNSLYAALRFIKTYID